MNFRKEVNIEKYGFNITHEHRIMMFGSCFSENIGKKLLDLKFNLDLNPFGIIFNPASIANNVARLLSNYIFEEKELFYDRGQWHSFSHHSRFSNPDKGLALKYINEQFSASVNNLKDCDFIIFTFGTAWIYRLNENNGIVANCHKLPSDNFSRELLKVQEIVSTYKDLMQQIQSLNPKVRFIFTISPVRHLKDGAHGNQISKSILQLSVNELLEETNTAYFPSYEIMLDDLRDYRFYDPKDMVHPSQQAIDYIFEKFEQAFFNKETQTLNLDISKILDACNHRPNNPNSEEHQKFIKNTITKIENLQKSNPFIDFFPELSNLKSSVI